MKNIFRKFRPLFFYAGLFSMIINMLMLIPSIYMLQVFDRVLTSRSNETLLLLTLGSTAAMLVMFVMELIRSRLLRGAGMWLDNLLGSTVLRHLLDKASETDGGGTSAYGLRDVATLRNFLSGNSIISLFDTPWLPFYVLLIYIFHPLLGIVATVGMLMMVLLTWINEKLSKKPLEAMQESSRAAGRYIDTSIRNAETIRAMGMSDALVARWQEKNDLVLKLQIESTGVTGWVSGFTKFLRQFIQMAMLGTGAYLVIDQNVSSGVMMASTIILGRALAPVEGLLGNWKSLVDARSAYNRLFDQLKDHQESSGFTELPAPQGDLSAEKIYFHAKGSEKPIIKDLSFQLTKGESVGIIGPSASGKTSLARLITGIWTPSSGTVRLDGADIATWPRNLLGKHVGYLPQDVELFPGTVSENIARLANAESAYIISAAQKAGAHEMILKLPKGYDTPMGEGGIILSGGQRQRIGLARALFGNPKLIVLDEPNSNLDADGEVALLQAIKLIKQDATTLIIVTHKPSLLTDIDKVLLLREGVMELFGPRDAVLARLLPQAVPQQSGGKSDVA